MIDKRRMRYIITAILVVVLGLSLTLCTSATEHGEPREVVARIVDRCDSQGSRRYEHHCAGPCRTQTSAGYDFKASDIAKIADTALLVGRDMSRSSNAL